MTSENDNDARLPSWVQAWESPEQRDDVLWTGLAFAGQKSAAVALDRDGRHLCHWAAIKGDVAVLRRIQETLADAPGEFAGQLGRHDPHGWTPLLSSVSAGQAAAVDFLLEQLDADALLRQNSVGCSALHYAAGKGHVDILRRLLQVAAADDDRRRRLLNLQTKTGETALIRAVAAGRYDAAALLLDAGASATVRNSSGESVYHLIAADPTAADHLDQLRPLLDAATPDDLHAQADTGTPLKIALNSGNVSLARQFKQRLASSSQSVTTENELYL